MTNSAKRARAEAKEPNRFKESKMMSHLPGSPNAPMNNTPQNVNSINDQRMTLSGEPPKFPYQDSGLDPADPRSRAPIPNENSGMPQFMVMGLQKNQGPFGMRPMPAPEMQASMTGSYLGEQAQILGLYPSMMGPTGMPTQPAPGGSTPQIQQSENALPVQGVTSTEVQPQGMSTKSGNRNQTA
tara:strand:+ start:24061 stop:24612 length:552 start_codon:yes stop_codon:yes gene_type:complete